MPYIEASIDKSRYITHISSSTGNKIIADEPTEVGGNDEGFSPSELLASSLASCTCITLRMYADRKEWDLERVEINVDYEYDRINKTSHFTKRIKLHGNLDDKQRERLFVIAEKCPISMALTNPATMQTIHL